MSRQPSAIQGAIDLLNAGQAEQAKTLLRRVLQGKPRDIEANKLMAMVHAAVDENEQALFYMRRAVDASPKDALLRFMLGNIYMIMKKDAEAVEAYRACSRLSPATFDGYDGAARSLLRMGRHDEGVAEYEKGLAATADDPASYRMYAIALSTMGRVPEGLAVLRRGAAKLPRDTGIRESLCYQSNFADNLDAEGERREHVELGKLVHEQNASKPAPVLSNTPDPDRKLRVGFVSGDFCTHACAMFMEGPIRELDRGRFEPYCYYTRSDIDPPTLRFEAMSKWRHCHAMSDDQFAAAVVADQIDVLIDTSGWTEQHRVHVMSPRLAPVQMTWLGYPNTTGLPTMGYRIVDAITDPPGAERWCTEKLVRLPGCFVSFEPLENAPAVKLTRALESGEEPITFGSFNRLSKVRPGVARVWARLLKRVPDSRLFLKSSLVSDDVKAQYNREFAAEGVDPARIEWSSYVKGLQDHLAAYHRVDIALDSFPYNGTTTTCEATWMGVPVVTLVGEVHRARVGASLLTALGLPGQIATTEEEYIEIAAGLAADRAGLREMHLALREKMRASPLCDAKGFARKLETAVRECWRTWCMERGGRGG